MIKRWRCSNVMCNNEFESSCPLCERCAEVGYEVEIESEDLLDWDRIYSIDEVLEEIEGKDDD